MRNLTPPGVEPHDFELSGRDVETIAGATVVFYLGHGFQPAVEDAIESTDANGLDLLEPIDLLEDPTDGGTQEHATDREPDTRLDPHVWLDPTMYALAVEEIGKALGQSDEAEVLVADLHDLDAEIERGLSDCERREIVTSHAAFGYLAKRYDLEQVALAGLSPEAEPAPGELRRLVDDVREHAATTIFFETLVSPRLAETIAREVGAKTAVLDPLEGLTQEQLDAGADYFTVMRANLEVLRRALGCR